MLPSEMRKSVAKWAVIASCCAIAFLAAVGGPASRAVAAKWTLRQLPSTPVSGPWPPSLSGVACPTESLCVAVGAMGTLAFSQAPTGGVEKWHVVNPANEPGSRLRAVSCASPNLCVAVSYEGRVYVSTDPTGGGDAWTPTVVNEGHGNTHLVAVSCPTPSFCAAVSGGYKSSGKVLTSTDPTSGRWQATQLGDPLDLRGVSCGTPSLCVAVAREGRIFVSTDPTGGASAWAEAGTPGGPGDLEGIDCVAAFLCAAGNLAGNILTSIDPAAGGASWSEANAGGSVQITDVSCPTASRCVAVDNNGDVLSSTDPTGGADSWHFENLVPFRPTEEEGQPPRNALFGASCASLSLCALVGSAGRIFTSTDPFSVPSDPPGGHHRKGPRRPRTILVFAEHFWNTVTRHRRIRARFRFYSPTRARGFECKRDRGRYRRCRSPLRYWVGHGKHVLRVRAIGPTGLRGRSATKRFRVIEPIR